MNRLSRYLPLLLLLAAACARVPAVTTNQPERFPGYQSLMPPAAEERARERLTVFAADDMAGREAGTEGERKAAAYLAEQLERIGVLPGGDLENGQRSYFQRFEVNTARFVPEQTYLTVHGHDLGDVRLGRDWLAMPAYAPTLRHDTIGVVFAGYGLSAPGHDDYAGIDAQGKLVVVLGGKPEGVDSLRFPFGTLDAANFQAKWVAAMQQGAAAVLFVDDPFFLDNWGGLAVVARTLSMHLPDQPQAAPPVPFLSASAEFGPHLLAALGVPAEVRTAAKSGQPVAPFEVETRMGLALQVEHNTAEIRNVVGYIPGDDKPDEYVAFGAHYDGHGTVDGVVYNGADDDGSGTIAILDVAEAFARDREAGHPTDRSLLFVFHTAEEKGLYGSEYFAANPEASVIGDIGNVVAQINIDMVGREHPDSLYVVGAYRLSTAFGERVDRLNERLGTDGRPLFHFNRTYDDPNDPENIYERSDHFNYARRGVPIVFFTDGMGANWRKNTPHDDYHRPTDNVDKIDFGKIVRTERLVYAIGRTTADAPQRPALDASADSGPSAR